MRNELITWNNPATIVDEFKQLLSSHNKVLLLVLGNTAQHQQLANDAVPWTEAGEGKVSWRYVVMVPTPQLLYPEILNLPLDESCAPLPPACDNLLGISIAM